MSQAFVLRLQTFTDLLRRYGAVFQQVWAIPRYWQDRILELREQIAAMGEGPLAVDG